MNNTVFGLVGTGGFAREIMPVILQKKTDIDPSNVFFVETNPRVSDVNGIRVLSEDNFLSLAVPKEFSVAIADSKIRQDIADRFEASGAVYTSVVAENATQYDRNKIGKGAIFCAYTTVTSNAVIGQGFHANIYSYIAHDCRIGDFVTFAPRVHCNGNTHIHDHVYIGTGAVIKQGTPEKPMVIGEGAVIGMGAVVTKSVPTGVTVLGNPARDITKMHK